MLSEIREKFEEFAARAGLASVPTPVLVAAVMLAAGALVWAAMRWAPGATAGGTFAATEPSAQAAGVSRAASASVEPTASREVVVHVVGQVRHPGVYRLETGARAEDAVKAAGGFLGNADEAALNLARVVADGEQLAVPRKGQAAATGGTGASGASAAPGAGAAGAQAPSRGKVDLNHATAQQLDALPGVGPATAAKIVKDRDDNGPFRTVEDLMRVPGIGPKKLDALKDLVTAG